MKNVLLIAFYYPPRNHVAGYRTGCFAKYLPENGWWPTVVCEDWPAGNPDYDPEFVRNIPPEIEVIRVANPRAIGFFEKVFLRKLYPYWRPYRAPRPWWGEARAKIAELTGRRRFDAVWATSDPLVTLGLAAETARARGVPWVADFRDSFNVQPFGSWYKRPVWARHERNFCRQADAAVTVSRGLADGLGAAAGRKLEVIENGFDPDLFTGPAAKPRPIFSIAYTGNLVFPGQNPKPLLQALELCLQSGAIPRNEVELVFHGPEREQIEAALPGSTTSLPIHFRPRVSHREIVPIQQASAVLLLLTVAGQKGVLTGKLFDYLAAGRTILAVPDDHGDVADVLRRTGTGVTAGSMEEISALLKKWHGEWKSKAGIVMPRNELEVSRYSRREQTKRLAGILDEVTGRSRGEPG